MNRYDFTERLRKALALAREEAVRLNHAYVGTEHELLGLLREGDGVAVTILENLNVPLEDVRDRLESLVRRGTGGPTGPDLPYTTRAKKVLELAMSEAREANHAFVGTEHLLLGMLREGKGICAQVLTSFGLTVDGARAEMHRIRGTGPVSSGALRRLPERIESVMAEAGKIARRAGAPRLEGLHIAIGLLMHREGIAVAAIERMGCDVPRLAAELEAMIPASDPTASAKQSPFCANLAAVLGAAENEQRAWNDQTMATHHLLIALLENCPDLAKPFSAQGITAERLRTEAKRIAG